MNSRNTIITLVCPDLTPGSFSKKLYATYLSYLPKNKIAYDLKMNCDSRGSFTEIIRSASAGQISVNISKPVHYKRSALASFKNEKFIVVKGHGLIQLRQLESDNIIDFEVNGEQLKVIQMLRDTLIILLIFPILKISLPSYGVMRISTLKSQTLFLNPYDENRFFQYKIFQ